MQFLHAPQLLKYSITPKDNGVLLCVWEPAPMNELRVKPFLFMARYRLPSKEEAHKVLGYYQAAYRTKEHV
jgi:hypothetical protein